jgi:NAD(P)-dependent dehydrogenase (short-subunit alcohol dehydrogenase family)
MADRRTEADPTDRESLRGRVAIVTGAGSRGPGIGNGRAIGVTLARRGTQVVLVDRSEESVSQTQGMIAQAGGRAMTVIGDVTVSADCAAIVAQAVAAYGRLDILVNNVGVSEPSGNAIEVDPDAWDAGMRTNVTSMMLMAKHAIPAMRAAGGGSIINISSIAGMRGGHASLLYVTSKGAVIALTRGMAAQHGASGIRVNCIAPGMVFTPMVAVRGVDREARRKATLLHTEGTAWDVAAAVAFLASDEARWITGVVLPVDAGSTAAFTSIYSPG